MDLEKLKELVAQRKTLRKMEKILDICEPTIRKYIRLHKLQWKRCSPPGPPGPCPLPSPEYLKQLIAEGLTIMQISKKLGIAWGRLRLQAKRLKIDYYPRRGFRSKPLRKEQNPAWRGGRIQRGNYWYIHLPEHPYATQGGYVLESRLVMEAKLGRYLSPKEVVHHKEGYENHPDNLDVYSTNGEHLADTLKDKVPNWTENGKRQILKAVRQPRGPHKKSNHAQLKICD